MKLLANKKFDYITRHYEGFEGAPISEWESFESVAEMAEFVEEYEELSLRYCHGQIAPSFTILKVRIGSLPAAGDQPFRIVCCLIRPAL